MRKVYPSIQVSGERSDIDNNCLCPQIIIIVQYLLSLQLPKYLKELSNTNSMPVYRIIIFCLSTNPDSICSIQQLQPY